MNDDQNNPVQDQTQPDDNTLDPTEDLKKQLEDMTEAAKRAMADLQNSKKRMEEEKQAFAKFATAQVFMQMLPIFDSLDRAAQHIPEDIKENDWVKGIDGITKQLHKVLENFDIKKMQTTGEKFDPNKHEAIAQDEGEKDIILEELEAGYEMGEHVIRPARVKVGKGE